MNWRARLRLWWNKKSGGTPLSNETPVQIAPMLNCPLWGAPATQISAQNVLSHSPHTVTTPIAACYQHPFWPRF